MRTYIVMLGPPGAGKGTQARKLAEGLGLPHVSTGDLFRDMKSQDTPLARQVQEIMARGDLVPDDLTVQIVEDRLRQADAESGAILDGFPRTINQAEVLDAMLSETYDSNVALVPYMEISKQEVVRRLSGRRSCPEGGEVYHVENNPPARPGYCDVHPEAELVQRPDDMPDVVERRFVAYQENTAPLIDYYQEQGVLVTVNADQSMDDVTRDLLSIVRTRLEQN